jgi:hypothetical protein
LIEIVGIKQTRPVIEPGRVSGEELWIMY